MMSKLGNYVINLLIAIDQLGTTLVGGFRGQVPVVVMARGLP